LNYDNQSTDLDISKIFSAKTANIQAVTGAGNSWLSTIRND
jgi:hypothetical protein